MATFRNRHGKWQARVQRKGQQSVSKSFQSKEDVQCKESDIPMPVRLQPALQYVLQVN